MSDPNDYYQEDPLGLGLLAFYVCTRCNADAPEPFRPRNKDVEFTDEGPLIRVQGTVCKCGGPCFRIDWRGGSMYSDE
ncbi:MAG: hypothetical protein QM756_22520 [Polyangiaceae bacterium]